MDPKFQTSFIPKSPVIAQVKTSPSVPQTDIFTSISVTLFVVTLLLLGGVYGYKYYLNKQIYIIIVNKQKLFLHRPTLPYYPTLLPSDLPFYIQVLRP